MSAKPQPNRQASADGDLTYEQLLVSDNVSAARAGVAVAAARAELDALQQALADLDESRGDILLNGTSEQLFQRDQAIARTRVQVGRLEALTPRLLDLQRERQASEDESVRATRRAQGASAAQAFADRFTQFHAKVIGLIADMQSETAAHLKEVAEINADLPRDAEPIKSGYSIARGERGSVFETRIEPQSGWVPNKSGAASHVEVPGMHKVQRTVEVQTAFWPEPYFKQLRVPHLTKHGFAIGDDA